MPSSPLFQSAPELEPTHDAGRPTGVPGKIPVTARLAARPVNQIIFRVDNPETARALAGSFGPRDGNGVAAGADVAVDRASSSSGRPLPGALQRRFESSLGTELSGVRVHTGAESAEAAHAVGARAYATGSDIHFADGAYQPDDPFGMHLLAHEVAHTVQQSGRPATRQHKLEVSGPSDSAEVEADRAADAMVHGAPFTVGSAGGQRVATGRMLQRKEDSAESASGGASSQSGLNWENGTALTEEEALAWVSQKQSVVDSAMGMIEVCTGYKVSLGAPELVEKLKKEVTTEYKAEIRTREDEIAFLENDIDHLEGKADAASKERLKAKKLQLAESENALDKVKDKRESDLSRVAQGAATAISTVAGYIGKASTLGSAVNGETVKLNPSLFKDANAGAAKVQLICRAVTFGSKVMDRTTLEAFQAQPSYETAKAWADSVGEIFEAGAGFAEGLPMGWGTVISSMMSMPSIVPKKFAKMLETRYAKIDAESRDDCAGKSELPSGGTHSKCKSDG